MKSLRKIIKQIIIESIESASGGDIIPSSGPLMGFEFSEKINSKVVDAAFKEYNLWKKKKWNEKSKDAFKTLKKYWISAGLDENAAAYCARRPDSYIERITGKKRQGHHWSAAFISHVMQEAGEVDFKDINHTPFFWKAYHNRMEFLKNPESFRGKDFYMVFFADEGVTPRSGNNLFYHRNGNYGRSLEYTKSFFENSYKGTPIGPNEDSHSDIYVGSDKAIGGNISNTVSRYNAKYSVVVKKITDFYFDPQKIESQTSVKDIEDFNTSDNKEPDYGESEIF